MASQLYCRRWSAISTHLPGRTDNEIKNYWNTHLKKRLLQMGIDPVTHKPKSDLFESFDAKPLLSSTLSHMVQWENARLEAEARLAREYLRFSSCSQPTENGIQPKDPKDVRAWKGADVCEGIRKEFSTAAYMEQSCNTDFRKILRDCEQSLPIQSFNVCHQGRFCSPDLSFPLSNGMVSLPLDVSHTALVSESFSTNLGLKCVPKLEHNPSPSSCSLDSMDDQPKIMGSSTDNSIQCESLLQQSEKLLQSNKVRSSNIIHCPTDKLREKCLAATESHASYISPAFSDANISGANLFWLKDNLTREDTLSTSSPPTAMDETHELLSQDTNGSISFPNTSCYSSVVPLPAELLLDLTSLQQHGESTCTAASDDLSSFSDQTLSMQSKDYWCNVLKLVGSPVLG
ncbi:hypothetical protein O6H91_15G027000 [Diphasiastrum complanatum]|uniref:Uncharacterized protein n=1 Tax=Diphasiastrum complanatum TaxID=34168 RepID=A0ACC2BGP4_DIPCM|nr:hypothetical protein O6H91_15G027000 [Diphasiastrum complanatum]